MTMHASIDKDILSFIARGYCNGAQWADAPEGSNARFPAAALANARTEKNHQYDAKGNK